MKNLLPIGFLTLALLGSLSGAVYYKMRASDYESRWADAMKQLETTLSTPKKVRETELLLPTAASGASDTDEIATLRARLQEKDDLLAQLSSLTNRDDRARGPRSPEEMQARMEELKKTDPTRYEEMMARREEFRQNMQKSFSDRAATLLNRDTSRMSPDKLAQYQNMLDLVNTSWELSEKISSPDLSAEERLETWQMLRETADALRPLLESERKQRFEELAVSSGYSESDAALFAQYINDTITATSIPGGRGGGGGRPPGR
jgi:hypothetical protein